MYLQIQMNSQIITEQITELLKSKKRMFSLQLNIKNIENCAANYTAVA